MKKNIYSPIDGELKNIEDLDDGVFSNLMLGPGFFIKPTSSDIYSPVENSKIVNIFDTKHAFILDSEDVSILVHIGIDTVKMEGKPYNYFKKINDNVGLNEKIVYSDFEQIRSKYSDSVCVTVINASDLNNFNFSISKHGEVKKGDLIGFIEYENAEQKIYYKNKYEQMAETIYNAVGKETNYANVYNCITRLRFSISNKSLVDENALKNLKSIQGYVWAGNELQIVIGPDVIKARDAYTKFLLTKDLENGEIAKVSFATRVKRGISGVMTMLIPYLIASGMLYAIFSILTNLGVVDDLWIDYTDISNIKFLTDYNIVTGVFYIICSTGLSFMGFAFGYCTVKFLGGNTVIGSLIGLSLIGIQLFGGLEWTLFRIGDVDFKIKSYSNIVIPQVAAAIFYVYFDKLMKKVIPNVVDLVLRHLICVFVTLTLTFFIIGPFMGLIELLFYYVIKFVDNIPFGISTAIFSILAPCLTVLGVAWAVGAPVQASIAAGTPNSMWCAWYLGEFAMAFSTLAVGCKTKNKNTRQLAFNAGITGIFGISEPALYTILLPRQKPFLCSIFSAGIAGLIVGILGLKVYTTGGGGLFFFTQFIAGGTKPVILALLGLAISATLSFISTFIFFSEKVDVKKELSKTDKMVGKHVSEFEKLTGVNANAKLEILHDIKEKIDQNWLKMQNDVDNILSEKISAEVKLISINEKNEKYKLKIAKKMLKEKSSEKIENLKKLYENSPWSKDLNEYEIKMKKVSEEAEKICNAFDKLNDEKSQTIEKTLDDLSIMFSVSEFKKISDIYYNILNSIEIFYEYKIAREITFTSKSFKKIIKGVKNNETQKIS